MFRLEEKTYYQIRQKLSECLLINKAIINRFFLLRRTMWELIEPDRSEQCN